MRRLFSLATVVLLLATAVAAPAAAQSGGPDPDKVFADRALGQSDAPVTVIEYASLTCPHCREFHTSVLPKLKANYIETGKVRFVYRDFPLDQLAAAAAMMARCAPEQRYFPMLNMLYERQNKWSQADNQLRALKQIGRLAGVGKQRLNACMQSQALRKRLFKNMKQAKETHRVQGTPTIIVNGDKLTKNPTYENLAARIDSALKAAGAEG